MRGRTSQNPFVFDGRNALRPYSRDLPFCDEHFPVSSDTGTGLSGATIHFLPKALGPDGRFPSRDRLVRS